MYFSKLCDEERAMLLSPSSLCLYVKNNCYFAFVIQSYVVQNQLPCCGRGPAQRTSARSRAGPAWSARAAGREQCFASGLDNSTWPTRRECGAAHHQPRLTAPAPLDLQSSPEQHTPSSSTRAQTWQPLQSAASLQITACGRKAAPLVWGAPSPRGPAQTYRAAACRQGTPVRLSSGSFWSSPK